MPDFRFETEARAAGAMRIAGVDEAGRGPLAGPVIAAAVILDPDRIPVGLDDSKKLTARRREALCEEILAVAEVGVGRASAAEIDEINILQASHLAMCRALAELGSVDLALVDGNRLPRDLPCEGRAIVKGDALSLSIAAASIVAKVWRDREMVALAQQHPGYGWERNKGYPSAEHRAALIAIGATSEHRRSFKPVHNILWQAKKPTP